MPKNTLVAKLFFRSGQCYSINGLHVNGKSGPQPQIGKPVYLRSDCQHLHPDVSLNLFCISELFPEN